MITLVLLLAALPAQAQADLCGACHSEQVADFQTHKHAQNKLTCAVCHGSSEKHRIANGGAPPDRVAPPDEVPVLCGGCHAPQKNEYSSSKHGKLVLARSETRAANCATCHGVHALRTANQRAIQCQRCHASLSASHPAAAAAACFTCHAKHTLVATKARQ